MPEIQDLKEQLAQALIDVVHDFDASWNAWINYELKITKQRSVLANYE
jgi:hypothetical protein